MASTTTYTEHEAVRLVGLRMLAKGLKHAQVAEATGAGERTVRVWAARLRRVKGDVQAAVHDAARPGAPLKLDREQRAVLIELLEAGPEAAGFEGALWTLPRVRQLIHDRFHVDYHVSHVGKLLDKLGFSPQTPAYQARERDPAAVDTFRTETWPQLVKKGV